MHHCVNQSPTTGSDTQDRPESLPERTSQYSAVAVVRVVDNGNLGHLGMRLSLVLQVARATQPLGRTSPTPLHVTVKREIRRPALPSAIP
jgi:hypothetical protein